jgi:hypothetical protein
MRCVGWGVVVTLARVATVEGRPYGQVRACGTCECSHEREHVQVPGIAKPVSTAAVKTPPRKAEQKVTDGCACCVSA